MSSRLRRSALRYGFAGIANTAVTLVVILLLDLAGGVDAFVANAIGYAAGLICAFVLGQYFVFDRGNAAPGATGSRYIIAVAAAFLLNQVVLAAMLAVVPPTATGRTAAQLAAMVAYSVTMFVLSYRWIFAPPR